MSVAIGQPAEIEVDALPNQKLKGVVSEIREQRQLHGRRQYRAEDGVRDQIAIIDPPKTLRPGMTASAEIVTQTNENALSVPLQSVAVRTRGPAHAQGREAQGGGGSLQGGQDGFVEIVFCIERGRRWRSRFGQASRVTKLIEILDGLKEGDEVVTGSYRAISKDSRMAPS